MLVVHFAASEDPIEGTAALHSKPSVWGQLAPDAQAQSVVLSHISQTEPEHPRYSSHSGSNLDDSVAHLRSRYSGPLTVEEDLLCVPLE